MSPIEAIFLIACVAAPFHWLVSRELDKMTRPEDLADVGIVIVRDDALEAHSGPVGHYRGRPIWGSVTFHGAHYRFDHVAAPADPERTRPGELYLMPGLIYCLG